MVRECDVSPAAWGLAAEKKIVEWLRRKCAEDKIPFRYRKRKCRKYDALINGWRVEFKAARFGKGGTWNFNISRRGQIDESDVDIYVLRAVDVPAIPYPLHFIFRAPLGGNVFICMSELIRGKCADSLEAVHLLRPRNNQ